MTPVDWARTILATEIVFASNLLGSGCDWSITTGFSDAETLKSLREIQTKVPRSVYAVLGRELGTRPLVDLPTDVRFLGIHPHVPRSAWCDAPMLRQAVVAWFSSRR